MSGLKQILYIIQLGRFSFSGTNESRSIDEISRVPLRFTGHDMGPQYTIMAFKLYNAAANVFG